MKDRTADKDSQKAADATWPLVDRRVNDDRRKPSLRSFLQGGLIPRRRGGRRTGDNYLPIDWHDPHLLFLSVVMLMLSVTDAFMTVTLLADGAVESNPLLEFILNEHPRWFAASKMALTGLGIIVLVALARSRLFGAISGRLVFQLLALAYLALVGYEIWLVSLIER